MPRQYEQADLKRTEYAMNEDNEHACLEAGMADPPTHVTIIEACEFLGVTPERLLHQDKVPHHNGLILWADVEDYLMKHQRSKLICCEEIVIGRRHGHH